MSRPVERPERRKGFAFRAFYCFFVLVVVFVWAYAFRSYFRHYDSTHPEIVWAIPWVQEDVIKAGGVLLWNEEMIASPRAGTVRFPNGRGPMRVPKGEVIASVSSGSSAVDVKSPSEGYFVAGLDGSEGKWRYQLLWPGSSELPKAAPVKMLKDGDRVRQGVPIGKIIPQPQGLRYIGYVDLIGNLDEKLASNRVMVKMDAIDTPSGANVRVYELMGFRAKVLIDVPWFKPEMLLSRNYDLIIELGETSGVAIPESAVTVRNGKRGAFVLKGADAFFVELKGRSIDGAKFLATDGLKLGDAVIADAYGAREGRVKLW
ncbi:MAG: efflux RND transporter periplasmic adaptor subunit [Synergistaceae bacterium]|jgi:hypothetical protein|nr:efflux RND transporter periplasmic adaptor subunit [Synergistaceae bacterium]